MKISIKLLFGFAIIVCFAVLVGVLGIVGMNRLREASLLMYDRQVLGLEYMGKANAAFKQVRVDCRQVMIDGLYDDSKGAADSKENYEKHAEEFIYWLRESGKIASTDELLDFYGIIEETFNTKYVPVAEMLITDSINDIPDHSNNLYINVYLASLVSVGEQMESLILGSMDLNTALANQTNGENERITQLNMRVQSLLIVTAVVAALIVSLYITQSISVPISESAEVLRKISMGAFDERVRGNYKGELALIKKSVNETGEQLSIYLKEKLQEDKIKELAAIVAIADAGIVVKDCDSVVRSWNIGAENILGYKPDEIIGFTTKDYAPSESHANIDETDTRLKNGEHIVHEDVVRKHKDGRLIDCSASYTPIFDEYGKFNGSVAVFHDVTENKKTERALHDAVKTAEEASQAKSSFLANMSHEIRTPMNGIIGFSELALDDRGVPAKAKEYLNRIKSSAEGLLVIINDILDISKIEAGKMVLESIPFDLSGVLFDCESICNPNAIDKGLSLIVSCEPKVSKLIVGDPTKLRQILLNLLSNAVKFTESGTVELLVSVCEADDDGVTLNFEVKDSGIGMTGEQIQIIFEPFMQADSSTTRQYGGTGIGLAITKNMVELMGGKLKVDSAPNAGSSFSFSLRFETDSGIAEAEQVDREKLLKLLKPIFAGDVLVCEDNKTNQYVVREHLARIGLKTTIADNGKQGVEIVKTRLAEGRTFEVIFMDIHMPVMDGLTASQELLETGNTAPIIALTANIMQDDIETYKKSGMVDCLGKPFKARELWDCLLKYLTPVKLVSLADNDAPSTPAGHGADTTIAHVDRTAGLEQSGGDEKLYSRLLANFANDNKTTLVNFQNALDEGDGKLAHRIAHTVKGVAGLIGASELQRTAYAVEKSLSHGDASLPNDLEEKFKVELQAVLNELTPFLKGIAADEQPLGSMDKDRIQEVMSKLEPLLETGSSKSLQLLDEIDEILSSLGEPSRVLISQIESYEFEDALETLNDIKRKLD